MTYYGAVTKLAKRKSSTMVTIIIEVINAIPTTIAALFVDKLTMKFFI